MPMPKPDCRATPASSSATATRTAAATACRSWCTSGFAYIGHIFSKGFSVIDVRDPTKPKTVGFVAAPPNTWTLHLQAHDDLLLVVHNKDMFAQPEMADERGYYKPVLGDEPEAGGDPGRPASPSTTSPSPDSRAQIGFMPVEGIGLHRIWYVGGRWAYASAMLDGFSDYILITIDMHDPRRPEIAGNYWLPGHERRRRRARRLAAAARPLRPAPPDRRTTTLAYCAWRDACLVVVDVNDPANPKLISCTRWAPPFGGGTHNALPLPDRDLRSSLDETVLDDMEDGVKPIWVFDNREKSNPICIATLPAPADSDYLDGRRPLRPAQPPREPPGQLRSDTLDLRHLPERRRPRPRHLRPVPPARGRRLRPAGAAAARRPAARPPGGAPLRRRLRRPERAHLLHRLERRGLYIMEFDG